MIGTSNISANKSWFFLPGRHFPDSHLDTQDAETLHFSASVPVKNQPVPGTVSDFRKDILHELTLFLFYQGDLSLSMKLFSTKILTFSYNSPIIVREA